MITPVLQNPEVEYLQFVGGDLATPSSAVESM